MIRVYIITSTLKNMDCPSRKLWSVGHGTLQIIISANTGTAKTLGKVIPEMNGSLVGIVFCVFIPNMSAMNLTYTLKKENKYGDIKKVLNKALEGSLKDILTTQTTRLSPVSLTVTPIPPSLMSGPVLPLITMLSRLFTYMKINLTIEPTLWTSWFTWLIRSKSSKPVLPLTAQQEERGPHSEDPFLKYTLKALRMSMLNMIPIPYPLEGYHQHSTQYPAGKK